MPRYHPRFLCPITGVQDPVACCRLILEPEDDEEVDPVQVCFLPLYTSRGLNRIVDCEEGMGVGP